MRGKRSNLKTRPTLSVNAQLFEDNICDLPRAVVAMFSGQPTIVQYSIERILHRAGFDQIDKWQSLGNSFEISSESIQALPVNLNELIALKPTEQIEQALVSEYGYILSKLANCNYQVNNLTPEQIVFGQQRHYQNLNPTWLDIYRQRLEKAPVLPLGIVYPQQDKFKVLDGYHRLRSSVDAKLEAIPVIIARPV